MRRSSRMLVFAGLAPIALAVACSDSTSAPAGDLPGDRGGTNNTRDSGSDARSDAQGDAETEPVTDSGTDVDSGSSADGG